ncbi:MAG: hypothetical protein SD837_18580 [Candidatus Electrothrix scaldis]|nr:MAG: hypothetical protein SD837_18580 [Candidatus Electrothrix sp. GW3-3]
MSDLNLFDDDEDDLTDFLEIIPEQFIVTEEELDQEVYAQFMAELEDLEPEADCAVLLGQAQELSSEALSLTQKKNILGQLAIQGAAEACQFLQQYCSNCEPDLEQWAKIALYECQMHMETDLFDEPVGLVSSGLGGEGEWLRYIFVLALQGECPAEEQQQDIEGTLGRVCRQNHSKVEQVQFSPSYLSVRILVPLDEAVGEVVEEVIVQLNQRDGRVREEYMVTNVAVPSEEEIQAFLNDLQ